MQDKTMLKISLCLVIIGIPVLMGLSAASVPVKNNADMLTDRGEVSLGGEITYVKRSDKVTKATLLTCMDVGLVAFDDVQLEKGDKVSIRGKKQKNEGGVELIVDRMQRLD